MSGRFAKHSVLRGGIDLWRSPTGTGTPVRAGVASAIAMRRISPRRKEKVLVTCRHVATGLTEPDRHFVTTVPADVEMYSGPGAGDRVTNGLRRISPLNATGINYVDAAMCQLYEPSDDEDGTNRVTAKSKLSAVLAAQRLGLV